MSRPRRNFDPSKTARYGRGTPLPPDTLVKYSPKWQYSRLMNFPFHGAHFRRGMRSVVVVSIDGGSHGNDSKNSESRAAYGVFFGSGCAFNQCGLLAHRVAQVSGRAEMEAVRQALLAVLRRRKAREIDGFREIILKTDSTYVANTFDDWVWAWKENGWRRKNGEKIKNLDLVKDIHTIICEMEADNMAVRFWRVDREWNTEADALVNEAFGGICDSDYGEA